MEVTSGGIIFIAILSVSFLIYGFYVIFRKEK